MQNKIQIGQVLLVPFGNRMINAFCVGFSDYLPDLVKYTKPDGTPFNAVTIETPDSIYLVKIKLKTDDAEALERWLEGEEDAENEEVAGSSADAGADATLPDDNISQYGGDDDGADGE
jgi:hypothetical protein